MEDDDEGKNHQHVHRAVKAKGAVGSPERDEAVKTARDKSKPVNKQNSNQQLLTGS